MTNILAKGRLPTQLKTKAGGNIIFGHTDGLDVKILDKHIPHIGYQKYRH
jgi:hypothetical protein